MPQQEEAESNRILAGTANLATLQRLLEKLQNYYETN
jgi:hypothetical protein